MRNCNSVWSALSLAAVAGMATASVAAPVSGGDSPTTIYTALPAPVYVDDPAALELANKLGLNRPPAGGLRGVCDPINDGLNCHAADLTLGANFSNTAAGAFVTMDNFTPTTSNPTSLCWIGRFAGRVNPIANESFRVRIYNDNMGFPDLVSPPVFERTFSTGGAAGVDQLAMNCLDTCPGTTDPVAGGHWIFTADVTGGFPVTGNGCYWLEIANSGTSAGGCSSDWNEDGTVNSGDISSFLTAWLDSVNNMNLIADFNGDNTVNSGDISSFLTAWLAQVGQPCPAGANWGWVGSQFGTDNTSLQAIDGAYTIFTRAANDRSFCFNGGVSPLQGNCTIAPLPPICPNDAANGIPDVGGLNNGFRASSLGSVGRTLTPGAWTPFQRAENFQFDAATSVDSICFGGFWLGVTDAGATVGIAAPSDPAFNVTYWGYEDGFPGAVPIADFTSGQAGVTLQWDGDDVSHVIHPPVNFDANTCYFVSVGRVQSAQATGAPVTPLWHWFLTNSSTPTGDERVFSRAVGPVAAWDSFTLFPGNPSNLWFLLSAGPTAFAECAPPPPPPPPANDLCADAVALATPGVGAPTTVNGTTIGALIDTVPVCPGVDGANPAGGVWYTVMGTGGLMTASTCVTPAPGYDGQISVFSGTCGAEVCEAGGDDTCGIPGGVSTASWQSTAGVSYLIMVHGWGGATGDFVLEVSTN